MEEQILIRLGEHVTLRSTTIELKMLFDRDNDVMYELNETGSMIVSLITAGINDVDTISSIVAEVTGAEKDKARADVSEFISQMKNANLLITLHVKGKKEWLSPVMRARTLIHDC